ncbi:MAG: hypothetical protein OXM01_17750, partial [Gemmatimonadota bacterium]|nr:hypothetical protein [Gemmatimonadota bacterium]
ALGPSAVGITRWRLYALQLVDGQGTHGEDMNLRKGVWAVAALFAAYATLYWYYVIAAAMPFAAQFSYFVGSCSVICMALGLLLSVRPRAVETSFGGLDECCPKCVSRAHGLYPSLA